MKTYRLICSAFILYSEDNDSCSVYKIIETSFSKKDMFSIIDMYYSELEQRQIYVDISGGSNHDGIEEFELEFLDLEMNDQETLTFLQNEINTFFNYIKQKENK